MQQQKFKKTLPTWITTIISFTIYAAVKVASTAKMIVEKWFISEYGPILSVLYC